MALIEAVQAGDAQAVEALLEGSSDVNELGPGGTTPLIEAAGAGRADLVKRLLEAGAEPSLRDGMQDTALLRAAAHGHAGVCSLLFGLAGEDECDTARAFLAAVGKRVEAERSIEEATRFQKGRAEAGAFVSKVLGDEDPARRLERLNRAEKGKKR